MTAFSYMAMDQNGKRQKGVLEADSARQVRQQLRERGLLPVNVVTVSRSHKKISEQKNRLIKVKSKRLSAAALALVTRQLTTLLSAGIPVDEALSAVAEQSEKQQIKSIVLGLRSRVAEGRSLAQAMEDFPQAFPRLYRTSIDAGERAGKLELVLEKLAEYTEKQQYIRQKIYQALLYPSMMTLISISVVVFLLIYVVPKIVDVFSQTHQVLPMETVILIAISNGLKQFGWEILVGLAILIYSFMKLLKRKTFRYRVDQFVLRLPVIGKTVRTVNGARFARTFGILNASSVPVLEAMHASARLIKPLPMHDAVMMAVDRVREGMSIHLALQKTEFFAPMFVHLIASGEASGQLEAMLEKAASYQENNVEVLIQNTLTLFEPLMILLMGAIVLYIVLAVMLPIFSLDTLGGM